MKFKLKIVTACAVLICSQGVMAQTAAKAPSETNGQTVKIAMIEG